ncbi:MAG: adenosylmethionine--8-amino-7-oxononanoate transaminase [Candidatus Nitrosocosmicus sp.]|uniref:adenosylmethionine--8-amino-7-oxononanoate transaminase n=1 Tax=Candidatus Nitrosocosmicus sp. FF01 TaxID=3397670 RepID=UPI0039EC6D93
MSNIDKVWYPYSQMYNSSKMYNRRIVESGQDFYFIDENGQKYLDGIANMWCNVWGFNENRITRGMIDQIRKIPHSTIFGLTNDKSIKLSAEFLKLTKGMSKIFYTDNGSSAIESALKMATQYWSNQGNYTKSRFLSIKSSYHGDTIGAMSVGYVDTYFRKYKRLLMKTKTIPKPSSTMLFVTSDNYDIKELLEKTEKIIEENSEKSIALVMESGAQIAGGVTIYPSGYQEKIAEICRKNNILFILDEIATGFGRLGNMIEYLAQNSIPDIACFGKAITGGYFPLAITVASEKIYKEFEANWMEQKQLFHGHTYAGHPVGCAAVIENLKMYHENHLINKIRDNSKYLSKRIQEFSRFQIVKNIRGKGLLAAFDLINRGTQISSINGIPTSIYVMRESLRRGVYLRSLGSTILFIPPLAIDKDSLEKIISTQYEIVADIQKSIG